MPVTPTSTRHQFYQRVLRALDAGNVPFAVGGAFALTYYCGLRRRTKDLDLFITQDDWPTAATALREAGIETDVPFPHWLAKARAGAHVVDLIFNGGNGTARVDAAWMQRGPEARLLDCRVPVCPPEEMIWSKAFIMERERFDGADVLHLLHAQANTLDWPHMVERFGEHWRILLVHLVLFGFVYPGDVERIPGWVQARLIERLTAERPMAGSRWLCRGTLLSRAQYLVDVDEWGYLDARVPPFGRLTREGMRDWTSEIDPAHRPAPASRPGRAWSSRARRHAPDTSTATGNTSRTR